MSGLVRRALPHLRELAGTARCVARYPSGLLTDRTARGSDPLSSGAGLEVGCDAGFATPVVLVHGYAHNRSAWHDLTRDLHNAGFGDVRATNHDPISHSALELAAGLARQVEEARHTAGVERVHLVGHSLGGLVVRAYVQLLGGEPYVDTAVTIATPHRGTHTARLALGASAPDIRPGSALLRQLDTEARPSPVQWLAYSSTADLLVRPWGSGRLDHPALAASNIVIGDTGHLGLLVSSRVTRSIAARLADAERDAQTTLTAIAG